MIIQEKSRHQIESAIYVGWMARRFEAERQLQSPTHYVTTWLTPTDPRQAKALAEAEAVAFFNRMAIDMGAVEGVEPEADSELE